MPNSYIFFDSYVVDHVRKNFADPSTPILDIGAGAGKYARLLPEYVNVDAVEIFPPYIARFGLNTLYRRVIIGDIVALAPLFVHGQYQLAILGDVLEHLCVEEASLVLRHLIGVSCRILVVVPYLYEQGECGGNPFEQHRQPDLTPELMQLRYPELSLLIGDEVSGVYIA